MNEKNLNENEKTILNALRNNPELEKCILEMIDIPHRRLEELERADDAEEAVVCAIRKTGRALLQEWTEKQRDRAEEKSKTDKSKRPHGKKK